MSEYQAVRLFGALPRHSSRDQRDAIQGGGIDGNGLGRRTFQIWALLEVDILVGDGMIGFSTFGQG